MVDTNFSAEPQGCSFLWNKAPFFAPESFSPEEKLMAQAAEDFCKKEVLPHLEQMERKNDDFMPNLIRKAGANGFCGIDCDPVYGGLGLGKNVAARLLEFLSLDSSFSVTIGITSGIGQLGLSLFGTEEQKATWLPGIAAGETIAAYALSEPNSGTDALSLTTSAVRNGKNYCLNGTKMWISNAKWAGVFLVVAKVDGERVTAFLVDRHAEGLTVEKEEFKLGLHGSSTARITLDNVVVPSENVIYEEGKGHLVALNALNIGRFKLASMSMGPARDAIKHAAAYVNERKQFGRTIGSFELVAQLVGRSAASYFGLEALQYRTGFQIDNAFEAFGGDIEGNKRAAQEFAVECSMSKVLATSLEATIIDDCLQCFGGYGFSEEYPLARHYRDARVSRIYEGTNEINRVFCGSRVSSAVAEAKGHLDDSTFAGELLRKVDFAKINGQVQTAAIAELAMSAYAVQSSRYRLQAVGSSAESLASEFENQMNMRAAQAYSSATGEATLVPKAHQIDWHSLLAQIYAANGVVDFPNC